MKFSVSLTRKQATFMFSLIAIIILKPLVQYGVILPLSLGEVKQVTQMTEVRIEEKGAYKIWLKSDEYESSKIMEYDLQIYVLGSDKPIKSELEDNVSFTLNGNGRYSWYEVELGKGNYIFSYNHPDIKMIEINVDKTSEHSFLWFLLDMLLNAFLIIAAIVSAIYFWYKNLMNKIDEVI